MLIATKIVRSNQFFAYVAGTLLMLGGSGFYLYNYYMENFNLNASPIDVLAIQDKLKTTNKEKSDNENPFFSQTDQILQVDLLKDPRFKSLKDNPIAETKIILGEKNPFGSKESDESLTKPDGLKKYLEFNQAQIDELLGTTTPITVSTSTFAEENPIPSIFESVASSTLETASSTTSTGSSTTPIATSTISMASSTPLTASTTASTATSTFNP